MQLFFLLIYKIILYIAASWLLFFFSLLKTPTFSSFSSKSFLSFSFILSFISLIYSENAPDRHTLSLSSHENLLLTFTFFFLFFYSTFYYSTHSCILFFLFKQAIKIYYFYYFFFLLGSFFYFVLSFYKLLFRR